MTDRSRLEEVVEALAGTPRSLRDVLTEDEAGDHELLAWIDAELFECEVCGWWCRRDEESDVPGTCDDCAPGGSD